MHLIGTLKLSAKSPRPFDERSRPSPSCCMIVIVADPIRRRYAGQPEILQTFPGPARSTRVYANARYQSWPATARGTSHTVPHLRGARGTAFAHHQASQSRAVRK